MRSKQNKPYLQTAHPLPRAARLMGHSPPFLYLQLGVTRQISRPEPGLRGVGGNSSISGGSRVLAGRPSSGRASGAPLSFPFLFFRYRPEEFKLPDSAGAGFPHPAAVGEAAPAASTSPGPAAFCLCWEEPARGRL